MPSLLSKSKNGSLARIINLSSEGEMFFSDYDQACKLFDSSMKEKDYMGCLKTSFYTPFGAYSISKSCNILFARELRKRYENKLVAVSVHPGGINTDLSRYMNLSAALNFLKSVLKTGWIGITPILEDMKNIPQGAATTLRCVSLPDDEIVNGGYYFNCRLGDFRLKGVASKDTKGELAKKLWQLSQTLLDSKGFTIR